MELPPFSLRAWGFGMTEARTWTPTPVPAALCRFHRSVDDRLVRGARRAPRPSPTRARAISTARRSTPTRTPGPRRRARASASPRGSPWRRTRGFGCCRATEFRPRPPRRWGSPNSTTRPSSPACEPRRRLRPSTSRPRSTSRTTSRPRAQHVLVALGKDAPMNRIRGYYVPTLNLSLCNNN